MSATDAAHRCSTGGVHRRTSTYFHGIPPLAHARAPERLRTSAHVSELTRSKASNLSGGVRIPPGVPGYLPAAAGWLPIPAFGFFPSCRHSFLSCDVRISRTVTAFGLMSGFVIATCLEHSDVIEILATPAQSLHLDQPLPRYDR